MKHDISKRTVAILCVVHLILQNVCTYIIIINQIK